jgi:hypothetical protein
VLIWLLGFGLGRSYFFPKFWGQFNCGTNGVCDDARLSGFLHCYCVLELKRAVDDYIFHEFSPKPSSIWHLPIEYCDPTPFRVFFRKNGPFSSCIVMISLRTHWHCTILYGQHSEFCYLKLTACDCMDRCFHVLSAVAKQQRAGRTMRRYICHSNKWTVDIGAYIRIRDAHHACA